MINLARLEEIVNDQRENFVNKDSGMERLVDFDKYIKTKQIVILSGIRRSGKSTLLRQFSKKLVKDFYYINFDDERLIDFNVADFDSLLTVWKKNHQSKNILIDEIQNIDKWERFIRRVYEEGYKIFITGSNAKLLSSELSTHLTGRYFKIEVYPFSFKECLIFNKIDTKKILSSNRIKIIKEFDNYLKFGGFPDFIKYRNKEFLERIYEDVVYKDIITRFGIKEVVSFRKVSSFVFSNFTKKINYNTIAKSLDIKSSISVRDYIGFLGESYLAFELFKYDYSLKKQFVSDKKVFVVDNGMRNAIAFSFSKENGRLLENLIFIELKRRGENIFFNKDKKECDFVIEDKGRIIQAIQVCYLLNEDNQKREIDGLIEALIRNKLKEGLIITHSDERTINQDGFTIKVIPAWKWLIS